METTLDQAVVNSFLRGLKYPVDKEELIHLALLNRVPKELVDSLQELPEGHYGSREEIMDHLQELGYRIS